ncbi:MAG: hypothetical protein HZB20_09990, partial [Chloroflexi bacterium]|nr:hypothetical protein [Chloroflexota bacterium]
MAKQSQHFVPVIERAVSLLVLAALVMFTYALFFQVPYQGFNFARNSIVRVFTPGELQPGDELVQVGPVPIRAFEADLRETIFDNTAPGGVAPIVARRGGQLLTIQWTLPGFNYGEFLARLTSQWWLAFPFWLAGEVVLLALRPRNTRWRLLIAFNSLTALWLSASSLSRWHVWESAIVLRMAIWLSVPVYLHLHWVFPKPLAPTPKWVWPLLYLVGALLAAAQWFQLLPVDLYQFGFLLALAGSALLLLAHYVFRPVQRSEVRFLVAAGALALLPPVGLGLLVAGVGVAVPAILLTLVFLPILPFAYIYAAYRRQLGELELRANQAVAVYLFLAGLGTVALTLAVALDTQFNSFGANILIDAVLITVTALIAIFGFAPFQRFIERRLLGMPLPPAELVESYAERITVSLDQKALAKLLTGELLP